MLFAWHYCGDDQKKQDDAQENSIRLLDCSFPFDLQSRSIWGTKNKCSDFFNSHGNIKDGEAERFSDWFSCSVLGQYLPSSPPKINRSMYFTWAPLGCITQHVMTSGTKAVVLFFFCPHFSLPSDTSHFHNLTSTAVEFEYIHIKRKNNIYSWAASPDIQLTESHLLCCQI